MHAEIQKQLFGTVCLTPRKRSGAAPSVLLALCASSLGDPSGPPSAEPSDVQTWPRGQVCRRRSASSWCALDELQMSSFYGPVATGRLCRLSPQSGAPGFLGRTFSDHPTESSRYFQRPKLGEKLSHFFLREHPKNL
jgi:hypothetical protein